MFKRPRNTRITFRQEITPYKGMYSDIPRTLGALATRFPEIDFHWELTLKESARDGNDERDDGDDEGKGSNNA